MPKVLQQVSSFIWQARLVVLYHRFLCPWLSLLAGNYTWILVVSCHVPYLMHTYGNCSLLMPDVNESGISGIIKPGFIYDMNRVCQCLLFLSKHTLISNAMILFCWDNNPLVRVHVCTWQMKELGYLLCSFVSPINCPLCLKLRMFHCCFW